MMHYTRLGVHCIARVTRPHFRCFSDPRSGALSLPGEPFGHQFGGRWSFGQMAAKKANGRETRNDRETGHMAVKKCANGREKTLNGREKT